MTLPGGTRLAGYEIKGPLGAGGMGEVYRAHDAKLQRDVAIKILPSELRHDRDRIARFAREASVLASLKHPNIAAVYGLEEDGQATALVMELVEGEDLSRLIAGRPMELHRALDIARQVTAALEAAHEQAIVHRDLKPGNIRVQHDGLVKVLDFGLAKSLTPTESTATQTALSSPGAIVGTAAYMSPEQARGETTGRGTDIWSFGVVLYEMLTGVSPFERPSTAETLAQVLAFTPDESLLPAGVPPGIRRLIRRCLERDVRRRWQHMGDVRILLDDALGSTDAVAGSATAPPISRRRAMAYGAMSVAALAAGFGAGRWFGRVPAVPSYHRLTFRRGLIRSARVAPDGQTIFYSALWEGGRCRVHAVRVDGPESRALDLPDANLLAVSSSGELAVALGAHDQGILTYGTLARVPMVGGAPRHVVEDVKFADWSPDGAELAIIRRVDGVDRVEYPVGTVLFTPTVDQGTNLGFLRVSPDGSRLAFVHYIAGPRSLAGHISILDRSGRVTVETPDYLNIHGLAWKGDKVLFTAADERPLYRGFHSVTPGSQARPVTRVPGNVTLWDALADGRLLTAQTDDRAVSIIRAGDQSDERDLSWLDASWAEDLSPDGRWLLLSEYGEGGGAEGSVYLRDVSRSEAVRLGPGRALALSPDARWALCTVGAGRNSEMQLVPTGAGEPRRLKTDGLIVFYARWLPDGGRLVFAARKEVGSAALYLYDLRSDAAAQITPEGVSSWAVSPDGTAVAVAGPGVPIRRYGVDNSAPAEIPGLNGSEVVMGWITRGLLVAQPGDAGLALGELSLLDLRTNRIEPWKNIMPRDKTGIMGQMTFQVTPDGHTSAYTWHRALSSLYLVDGLG